jgi:hypothetical protein
MTRPPRWFWAALFVFMVGLLVTWRVASTTYGRDSGNTVHLNDPSQVRHLKTVGDYESSGEVSIFRGRAIVDFFRIQIPINPYIYSQARQMDIRTDRTYLITNDAGVFRQLRSHLEDVRVYRDARDLVYEGVRLPNAFVLETPRSLDDLSSAVLPELRSEHAQSPGYLVVNTRAEWRAVSRMGTVPEGLGLVVERGIDIKGLSSDRLDRLGDIYVLGRNARRVGPRGTLGGQGLKLVEKGIHLGGAVPVGTRGFRALVLIVLALAWLLSAPVTVLGASWFVGWIVLLSFLGSSSGLLIGLFVGPLLDRLFRRSEQRVLWLLIIPLFLFGIGWFPDQPLPYLAEAGSFWVGAGVSVLLFFPALLRSLDSAVRVRDVLWIVAVLCGVYFLWEAPPADVAGASFVPFPWHELLAASLLVPFMSWFGNAKDDLRTSAWLTPLVLWSVLALYPVGIWPALVWPLVAGITWILFFSTGDRSSPRLK